MSQADVRIRLTYVLATFSLIPALVCLALIATPGSGAGVMTWTTLLVSGAIAAICLTVEFRRDRWPFAMFCTVFAFLVALVGCSFAVLDDRTEVRLRSGALGLLGCALLAGCVWMLIAERRRADVLPDHLLARFDRDALYEIEGVVWTATAEAHDEGELLGAVTLWLQSAVDQPRTVRVRLVDVHGFWDRRGALATQPVPPFELPPGALAACHVPVAPGTSPAREARLYVEVDADGPPGRRLRKHRGQVATRRTTMAFRLVALLGAHLVTGGGVRAVFANTLGRGTAVPPAPTWRTIAPDELGVASGAYLEHQEQQAHGLG